MNDLDHAMRLPDTTETSINGGRIPTVTHPTSNPTPRPVPTPAPRPVPRPAPQPTPKPSPRIPSEFSSAYFERDTYYYACDYIWGSSRLRETFSCSNKAIQALTALSSAIALTKPAGSIDLSSDAITPQTQLTNSKNPYNLKL